jgi:hypothetical protein
MLVKSSYTTRVNSLAKQEEGNFTEEYWTDEYSEKYADEDEW